ncbi:ATP-dependent DNA helicase PIF1 [Elysia marginata]|uniref:ATP-dependent DNA helicase n=1 Tax=Elysia marginata TaxID=1093978 RepID=A0AAV4JGJ0_9GAST|nr:ATP-dependent DNA helicase PIF1 [Elysia marginata]
MAPIYNEYVVTSIHSYLISNCHKHPEKQLNVTTNDYRREATFDAENASGLMIDEAPMIHKKVLEALDRTLRHLRETDEIMGGLPTLLSGDFRQMLPVVPNSTRAILVEFCLKKKSLFVKLGDCAQT